MKTVVGREAFLVKGTGTGEWRPTTAQFGGSKASILTGNRTDVYRGQGMEGFVYHGYGLEFIL